MAKFFIVLPVGQRVPKDSKSCAFLLEDNWTDRYRYNTMYTLLVIDSNGMMYNIGSVKIGQVGWEPDQRRPSLGASFDMLGEKFFSVGQDGSYYSKLNDLGVELRDRVLKGLRDMAFDLPRLEIALREKVTGVSLLRTVTRNTVQGQYARLARGGVKLSRFNFSYFGIQRSKSSVPHLKLTFVVEPDSKPPTNIHVLIGRNGVGKTHLLHNMSRSLVDKRADSTKVGRFEPGEGGKGAVFFANLVSVSFSAFDQFEPPPNSRNRSEGGLAPVLRTPSLSNQGA